MPPQHQQDSIAQQTAAPFPPCLTNPRIQTLHGMFSCLGGVSTGPFASLNLSFGVGDDPDNVRRNRQRVVRALGCSHLVSIGQVHGDQVLVLDKNPLEEEAQGYDAIISNLPGVALLIQQADCQAILLFDPLRSVVAAIHCGWRGSATNIIAKTIAQLRTAFAVDPVHLQALISPSLGPCCAEFTNFQQELPTWMQVYQLQHKPAHFDFWAISRRQLSEAGVLSEQIHSADICTRCNRDYFSFRRAKQETGGLCGRNGSLISLATAATGMNRN